MVGCGCPKRKPTPPFPRQLSSLRISKPHFLSAIEASRYNRGCLKVASQTRPGKSNAIVSIWPEARNMTINDGEKPLTSNIGATPEAGDSAVCSLC
jgi:hypothetical protein